MVYLRDQTTQTPPLATHMIQTTPPGSLPYDPIIWNSARTRPSLLYVYAYGT